MKRLVGYDLNGWRDLAVRNWVQRPGEDDKIGPDVIIIISGGIDGCVVSLNDNGRPKYVGGAQAEFAPHGLGVGWGAVGAPERRIRVRELIASPDGAEGRIAASLTGLARQTDVGVLAISDIGTVTEEAQEALIDAMRRAGVRRRLLVWRPVLALLGAMRDRVFEERERIGIVTHEALGFGTQVLTLRQGKVLAPERSRKGLLHCSALGLGSLCDSVFDRLFKAAGQRSDYLEVSSIPIRVVLGEQVEAEVLRRDNGSWEMIQPPALPAVDDPETLDEVAKALCDCDRVLFETPARGLLAEGIVDELSYRLDVDVCGLPPETVATGARVAAERLNDGTPVFFDFLPQISTIVIGEKEVQKFNLIPKGALLPAGEIYRSCKPAKFAILAGQDHIKVYLKKETVSKPRLANISLGQPVDETTTVELSVEQRPVSGRARLTLSSQAFVTPHVVDFDAAEPQEKSWGEIIESLKRPRPAIPDRMILPNGLDVWDGIAGKQGLSAILAESQRSDEPNWKLLADIMASRPEGRYALNSDGEPPEDLREADLEALDQMLNRAESEVHHRITSNHNPDNHRLRFTTWTFRRCPQSLIAPMLETLDSAVGKHPLLPTGAARTLIYQGLGRTLCDDRDMRRVMDHLFGLPFDKWNKNHCACMGFLISRTDEAPRLLQRKDVDNLAEVVAKRLKAQVGSAYGPKFIYFPILLVGLLRWRMIEPYALVSKQDPAADLMGEALDGVIDDLKSRCATKPKLQKHHDLLCKSRDVLAGEGKHPGILTEMASEALG